MPLGSLVGKTVEDPFFVGNSYEGSPATGRLYLSVNDRPDSYADNNGSIRVVVTIND
jgi:hypothetical protein